MNTRKEFLAASSLFALAPAIAEAAGTHTHAAPPELTFDFDSDRFAQMLAKPAKHKQCFGAAKLASGSVLEGMNNSIRAYDEFLKEGPGAMQAVAVLYHGPSIGLALSDSVWNDILIPTLHLAPPSIREDVGKVKAGSGNPYLRSKTSDPNDVSVERLAGRGSAFFVCHNAIAGFAQLAAPALKETPSKVHAALMAGIVPGALVVPAGVMAINACQEAKFTYISAS